MVLMVSCRAHGLGNVKKQLKSESDSYLYVLELNEEVYLLSNFYLFNNILFDK